MWINQAKIRSETSNREYTISELAFIDGTPTGTFGCSCPGWIKHGGCKHLESMGLPSARERHSTPKGLGNGDNSAFSEDAYTHYDPTRNGHGSSAEWRQLAETLKGGNVNTDPDDGEWDEIFLLVDTREMTENELRFLDQWAKGLVQNETTQAIINWLKTMPFKSEWTVHQEYQASRRGAEWHALNGDVMREAGWHVLNGDDDGYDSSPSETAPRTQTGDGNTR